MLSESRAKYGAQKSLENVWEPIETAPPEVRKIVEDVLKIERRRISTQKTYGISNDILKVIKDAIPE
ncbi:MAG: hypothetical protein J7641_01765 [Cyanobacteria bacterium SID2]|nr:hypothetical protein [Cyanobacteria bacterium SID2]MBP0003075.1 hypothetical protein [Cyanobacteria bacterium SBC]